jgi:WD40 repeat protein
VALLRGDTEEALKVSLQAVRIDLALPVDTVVVSSAAAVLAAAVWQTDWRLVLRGHEGGVSSASFSPDGARIVTASTDETARIWDAATGREIEVLRGHKSSVESAAFSTDGTRIVTASWDETARVWDTASGNEIKLFGKQGQGISFAAFSPDGARVVISSGDKMTRIWDARFATMSTRGLLAETCARRLQGISKLSHDDMRLLGYSDSQPEIDVCDGVQ